MEQEFSGQGLLDKRSNLCDEAKTTMRSLKKRDVSFTQEHIELLEIQKNQEISKETTKQLEEVVNQLKSK